MGPVVVLLLDDWERPEGYWVCAGEPQYARRQIESIEEFDSVQYILKLEYDAVERGEGRTVTYAPDGKQYRGTYGCRRSHKAMRNT